MIKRIIFALALIAMSAWAEDGKRDYLALPFSRALDAGGDFALYSSDKAVLISEGEEIYVIANVRGTCCLLGLYDDTLPILRVIDAAEWFSGHYFYRYADDIAWLRTAGCYAYTGGLEKVVADWHEWMARQK